jgi:hypothetical protein
MLLSQIFIGLIILALIYTSFFLFLKMIKYLKGEDQTEHIGVLMMNFFIINVVLAGVFNIPLIYQTENVSEYDFHYIRNKNSVVVYNDTLMREFDIAGFDSTKLNVYKYYYINGKYESSLILCE